MALTRPRCASEMTSCTPVSSRSRSDRKNSVQNVSSSLSPTAWPRTSRRPSADTPVATGSNQPVLGTDATSATSRVILGVPLFVSQYVAPNTLWAVDRSRVWVVLRADATVEADRSVFFTSDRVAVKATMRVGFGFVHPQAVVKIATA